MRKSYIRILEEFLAPEQRRIASDWRAALAFRKYGQKAARFHTVQAARRLLFKMEMQGELQLVNQEMHLYFLTSPYAQRDPVLDWEFIMEINPYGTISHHSAMCLHFISDDFPKTLHVTLPFRYHDWFPIGTHESDWDGQAPPPRHRRPKTFQGKVIRWHVTKRLHGIREFRPFGYPIRATTPERTLLDGLLKPQWCGGIESVFRGWASSMEMINIQDLIDLVDILDMPILRQRTGFILETLGIFHPSLDKWADTAMRGGTAKLVSNKPYSATYSKRWCLSLNGPIKALSEGGA